MCMFQVKLGSESECIAIINVRDLLLATSADAILSVQSSPFFPLTARQQNLVLWSSCHQFERELLVTLRGLINNERGEGGGEGGNR